MRRVLVLLPLAMALCAGSVAAQGADQAASGTGASVEAVPITLPAQNETPDALFSQPYIDIDVVRDTPVRHRYVHGGFRGTETRFSYYFPMPDQYQGRFFQHITPVPDSENNGQRPVHNPEEDKVAFALSSGAYFVETNGGGASVAGFGSADPTIGAYRANAAAARYSRILAEQMYGRGRPYGYAYGGSGGGYRTIGSIENTQGVWDGVVPYVIGSTMAIPNMFTVRMHAMRILADRFDAIVDAVEPGGSGDPYTGLNQQEADALREVTRMGFPLPSWFGHRTMGIHGFAALYQGVVMADPSYFTDFWTKPGYLGFDNPASFDGARMQHSASIVEPITAAQAAGMQLNTSIVNGARDGGVDNAFGALQGEGAARIVAFRLSAAPPAIPFLGGDLVVQSGAANGQRLTVSRIVGDIVVLGVVNPSIAASIAAGDAIVVDNSNFLAAQTYHRHQVPGPDFPAWDQFRRADGTPLYPQRSMLLGPLFTQATAGSLQTGRFNGRMIVVASLWDREALPWQADWYRQRVAANLGPNTNAHFRLWYTDHALHGDDSAQDDPTHTVSYLGVLHQALRDLATWVEQGIEPPTSTNYVIRDAQVVVPGTARERGGIQPVVRVAANGAARADVRVGQSVTLTANVDVPPGTGTIVAAQWDLDGQGRFDQIATPHRARGGNVSYRIRHRFDRPGNYFVTLRAVSQRDGDARTPFARIQNIGRARIVVSQ